MAFLLSVTAYAAEEPTYIFDHADIFTDEEENLLKWYAEEAETIHKLGLYIATVEDYKEYDEADVFEAARQYYILNDLGVGPEHGGLLLLLSMAERDFAIIAYGEYANTVFYDIHMELMSKHFVDKVSMSEGNMYDSCDYYLSWRVNDLETFRANHRSEYRAFVREASRTVMDEDEGEKDLSFSLPSQETVDDSKPIEDFTLGEWVILFGFFGVIGGCCVAVYKLLALLIKGFFGILTGNKGRQKEYDDSYETSRPVYRGSASPSVRVYNRTNVRIDNGLSYRDKTLMRRAMNAQINRNRRQSNVSSHVKSSTPKTTASSRGKFRGTSGKF